MIVFFFGGCNCSVALREFFCVAISHSLSHVGVFNEASGVSCLWVVRLILEFRLEG